MPNDRRPRRDQDEEQEEDTIWASDLLESLNETHTIADVILNDNDKQKRIAMGVMARHSAVAKNILDSIEDDESLRLGTINSINVLRLMSDIYDNKIPVINQ
ncbi:P12 [Spodoptera exempta nucleopolyhedrovirus]|uniref:P12 n=1 Tax=Spodoptera exempta nucleopolyhedrovirus TaxID=1242863 RepID=A0A410S7Q3_9ABAC|nr:P12 [Spodoptera exempta nucleopolyhedrovirus]QAT90346.1 P12 [Spodoptera exempta nucleopolyhedrovirus]